LIFLDGKKVRHAGVQIVNTVDSQGRFLGSVLTQSKSIGIAARQLLDGQDLLGMILVDKRFQIALETTIELFLSKSLFQPHTECETC
jgi:hypothetical protein